MATRTPRRWAGNFDALYVDAMSNAAAAIDLGTGDGERLIALCNRLSDRRPSSLAATEGWKPNDAGRIIGLGSLEVWLNSMRTVMSSASASASTR